MLNEILVQILIVLQCVNKYCTQLENVLHEDESSNRDVSLKKLQMADIVVDCIHSQRILNYVRSFGFLRRERRIYGICYGKITRLWSNLHCKKVNQIIERMCLI